VLSFCSVKLEQVFSTASRVTGLATGEESGLGRPLTAAVQAALSARQISAVASTS